MILLDVFITLMLFWTPKGNIRTNFTSQGANKCSKPLTAPPTAEESIKPWKPAIIQGETEFTARIGPTGGKKGYSAINGDFIFQFLNIWARNFLIFKKCFNWNFKFISRLVRRSAIVGHCLVHQRSADPRNLRRRRQDVHLHRRRRWVTDGSSVSIPDPIISFLGLSCR